MKHLRVNWKHPNPAEPVVIYVEIDDRRFEVRKIEQFLDGTLGYASAGAQLGGTALSEFAVPEISAIAAEGPFEPTEITEEEFDRIWKRANTQAPGRHPRIK